MPRTKTPKTIVVFRRWRTGPKSVIALLPAEPADNEGRFCNSYEHVGQHGGVDYYGVVLQTGPAKPAEYRELAGELRRIGYRLQVRRRGSYAMHEIRRAAARS
jgi:hypothetical protein